MNFFSTPFIISLVLVIGVATYLSCNSDISKNKSDVAYIHTQIEQDQKTILIVRHDLQHILSIIQTNPVFKMKKLTRDQRKEIWGVWNTFLDVIIVLDVLYEDYASINNHTENKALLGDVFNMKYAIFLIQYRYAMDIVFELEKNHFLHKILNEPIPELGLPKGTYSDQKYRFLNVIIGAEFARLSIVSKKYPSTQLLSRVIKEDSDFIWKTGKGKGPYETLRNGAVITKDSFKKLLFPVKKRTLKMAKLKVRRRGEYLITKDQQKEMLTVLKPGDILLERREWHISNLGIPGFWPHVALYIGTSEDRRSYFSDATVYDWVREQGEASGDFEMLLKKKYPKRYKQSLIGKNNEPFRVLESYDAGVSLTQFSFSTNADSVASLRPKTSKVVKANAILQAFHFLGRPYDFDFDFQTDSALVCTELVAKAYESTNNLKGLHFPSVTVMGKEVVAPNLLVREFDQDFDQPNSQFDFVFFYDANEFENHSKKSTPDLLRKSWKRPKWHILIKH